MSRPSGGRSAAFRKRPAINSKVAGRGDSTRSAYLFFHADRWDDASIDVFVDETTRGLSGNLALVLSGPPLGVLGSAAGTLSSLSAVASSCLPKDHPTPLTLRLRLPDSSAILGHAEVEVRFKLRVPSTAIAAGPSAVVALSAETTECFEELLGHETVRSILMVPETLD